MSTNSINTSLAIPLSQFPFSNSPSAILFTSIILPSAISLQPNIPHQNPLPFKSLPSSKSLISSKKPPILLRQVFYTSVKQGAGAALLKEGHDIVTRGNWWSCFSEHK
jgi:hypothetical protein